MPTEEHRSAQSSYQRRLPLRVMRRGAKPARCYIWSVKTTPLSLAGARIRLVLAVASLGAASWGAYLFTRFHDAVYWNLGSGSHVYAYVHPAIYGLTVVTALAGGTAAVLSLRSPGTATGWVVSTLLAVLLSLALWACVSTLLGRAYAA